MQVAPIAVAVASPFPMRGVFCALAYRLVRRMLFLLALFAAPIVSAPSDAAGGARMADCYANEDLAPTKVCRARVWATYHAVQVAQATHGRTDETCQFGVDVTADQLVELVREGASDLLQTDPVAATLGALSPPATCRLDVTRKVGGMNAGSLLDLCGELPAAGTDPALCVAYVAALRDSLNVVAGSHGADNFFCSPRNGIEVDEATRLLREQVASDRNAQLARPAAEVMAEALARKFPCTPAKPEDVVAIVGRSLELIEQEHGKVTALALRPNADAALAAPLGKLRPVVSRKSIAKMKTHTLPGGYLIVQDLSIKGADANFAGILGPGALAGTMDAISDCGLRIVISFSFSDGKWHSGPYMTQQCSAE